MRHKKWLKKGYVRSPSGKCFEFFAIYHNNGRPFRCAFFDNALPLKIVIYVDDVALRCVGKSSQARTICRCLQESLSAVSSCFKNLGLSESTSKASSFLYRRRACLLPSSLPLFLRDQRACRERKHRHLGLLIDDRIP